MLAGHAVFTDDGDIVFPAPGHESAKRLYPITQLGVLKVAGKDAPTFLQGQITCNINDITTVKSSFGAMCNPKGKTLTTFLLVKVADAFLMVLPNELLASVKKKLQMYVLRADVALTDCSDEYCLIGVNDGEMPNGQLFATQQQENIEVDFQNRRLIIATFENAKLLWEDRVKRGYRPESPAQWRYLDIISGIPWLSVATSEEFIPQMLNIDKLGGISLNKGCYTGQEIVARTHYLGKTKREMLLAECNVQECPEPNAIIVDANADTGQSVGKVLCAQIGQHSCKMLIVLQISDADTYSLRLKNQSQDKISLLAFGF